MQHFHSITFSEEDVEHKLTKDKLFMYEQYGLNNSR